MNINSSINLQTIMNQGIENRPQRPQQPLKEQVDAMSEEDRTQFDSKIDSLSGEQRHALHNMLKENETEISQMSQEEASKTILELAQEASQLEVSEDSFSSMMSAQEAGHRSPPPPGGQMGHRPPPTDIQDPFASLDDEETTTLSQTMESMSDEQKMEFGYLLSQSKDELDSLSTSEASDLIFELLEEASNSEGLTTSSKYNNGFSSSNFIDTYA
jgi:succinate dehydrogenase flavin-adding protein (antitoxin of CptAB toxin-antitoxin module)